MDAPIIQNMHVDFLTLACLRDELDVLLGGRVQHVMLPDNLSLGLELYAGRRHYLLLSADARQARILLSSEKLRRGAETVTPLLLLARKWLVGARLTDISQPAWERILVFHFEGAQGYCQLVAEIMDRYSNVVLVAADGCVLGAVKHIGPRLNRYRVTLPNHPYQLPPAPAQRRPPGEIEWRGALAAVPPDMPLHQLLTARCLGVSPTLAREVAARVAGDPQAPARMASPEALVRTFAELFAPLDHGGWQPHVALDDAGQVIGFTAYQPRQFAHCLAMPSVSAAMQRYFDTRLTADAYAIARSEVLRLIEAARARVQQALSQLRAQMPDTAQLEAWRRAGELLLAYQQQVPPGASEVTLTDYAGQPCTIALDPTLGPIENARAYFRRCEKARRALEELPARIEALTNDDAYLAQLTTDLMLAETRPAIDAVYNALAAAGWTPHSQRRHTPTPDILRASVDGFTIFVGRNAQQNEEVTFRRAGPDDLWLHARGVPGAHVIIKSDGRPVPEAVVEQAARWAAYYSAARQGTSRVQVDVTERRYVRRLPGGRPGLVTYRHERSLWVASPDRPPTSVATSLAGE